MDHRRPDTNASPQLHSDQLPLSTFPQTTLIAGSAGVLTTAAGSLANPANTACIPKFRFNFIKMGVLESQRLAARFTDSGERVPLDGGRPTAVSVPHS